MPRKLRVEFPGAIYHVMSRGDRRKQIFQDDVDRQDFIKTLAEACQKTGFEVHAYCLMGNHFHLVVETPEANLVAGKWWLMSMSTCTIRLNHRHQLVGHVVSGRYQVLLVEGRRKKRPRQTGLGGADEAGDVEDGGVDREAVAGWAMWPT